ncbi:hypothetical protein SH1V18_44610 [Vallitalea longa]|uniref:VanZ-like domain-containing protein n=1 Tax=Vallitalea longa TaxID=2936439 RepID=A0A9W6DG66_9FIRM|nr:VanZ family protein [Vallitalea longa]GKX31981.1 hypothetical protein SH1V18_44610 [Vallitalea longa]
MSNNASEDFKRFFRIISFILFIIYLMFLINVLFLDEKYGRVTGVKGYNLEFFKTIKNYIKYSGTNTIMRNIFGNIVAFMPFGFFIPVLLRKTRHLIIMILLSGLMSLLVEVLQYHFAVGSFDVDDIILNTVGGFLGYLIYKICYYIYYGFKYLHIQK